MATFGTRVVLDPLTGLKSIVRAQLDPVKIITVDELRKEIQVLKDVLLKQEELRAENDSLRAKLKEHEWRAKNRVRTLPTAPKEPTKEMLLAILPELEFDRQETEITKDPITGQWVEKKKRTRKKKE